MVDPSLLLWITYCTGGIDKSNRLFYRLSPKWFSIVGIPLLKILTTPPHHHIIIISIISFVVVIVGYELVVIGVDNSGVVIDNTSMFHTRSVWWSLIWYSLLIWFHNINGIIGIINTKTIIIKFTQINCHSLSISPWLFNGDKNKAVFSLRYDGGDIDKKKCANDENGDVNCSHGDVYQVMVVWLWELGWRWNSLCCCKTNEEMVWDWFVFMISLIFWSNWWDVTWWMVGGCG